MRTIATVIGKGIWLLIWAAALAVLAIFIPFSREDKMPYGNDEEMFV